MFSKSIKSIICRFYCVLNIFKSLMRHIIVCVIIIFAYLSSFNIAGIYLIIINNMVLRKISHRFDFNEDNKNIFRLRYQPYFSLHSVCSASKNVTGFNTLFSRKIPVLPLTTYTKIISGRFLFSIYSYYLTVNDVPTTVNAHTVSTTNYSVTNIFILSGHCFSY